jgi:hypothetical protein
MHTSTELPEAVVLLPLFLLRLLAVVLKTMGICLHLPHKQEGVLTTALLLQELLLRITITTTPLLLPQHTLLLLPSSKHLNQSI